MRKRILLVDDEDEVLDAWETSLKILNHQIVKARDEKTAVAAAMEHPFDLIIADYLIPPKTGVEIIAAVRKTLPLIRSIVISARFDENVSKSDLREIIREKIEVDEYMHKPVKPKLLRETVSSLLGAAPLEWKEVAQKSKTANAITDQDTAEVKSKLSKHLKKP